MLNIRLEADAIARIAAAELDYDPITGVFTRRFARSRWKAGAIAGGKDAHGYIVLKVGQSVIKAHRLAWFITNGELPDLIDHINGDRADNRIVNLRAATKRINAQNSWNARANNERTGLIGVTKISGRSKRWSARITNNGQRLHLGSFASPEEAHQAYLDARASALMEAVNAAS